ncbi:MAG: mechanosensitive ion channel [Rhodothermales bacterium]|nr:mechanosensitive ion channel [Rhodothermales bacterium]
MDINGIEQLITDLITSFLPKVVGVIVLLAAAWIIGGWIGRKLKKSIASKLDESVAGFIGSVVRYTIIVIAFLTSLTLFGIETTSFAAIIGAAGLAIGLAMQGALSNFASGVMLLSLRPFKIGDVVTLNDMTAKVVDIGFFSCEFDTFDNRRVTIPNGKIIDDKIQNNTYHDQRRVDVAVGTDYPADLTRTREILMNAARSVDGIVEDPEPAVVLTELGGSSINWSVRVWANTPEYWDVKQLLIHAVKMHLDEAGIGIPFPQMDVHMDGGLKRFENGAGNSESDSSSGTPLKREHLSEARHDSL